MRMKSVLRPISKLESNEIKNLSEFDSKIEAGTIKII